MDKDNLSEAEDAFSKERFAAKNSLHQLYVEKWIDISLDTDRQLLTLSTAAIGLLATFVTSKGVSSVGQIIFLIFAGIAFISVIAVILIIFKMNGDYLGGLIKGKTPEQGLMKALDKLVRISFFTGIVCTAFFALNIAISDLEKSLKTSASGEKNVTRESSNSEKPSGNDAVRSEREFCGYATTVSDAPPDPQRSSASKPASPSQPPVDTGK